MSHFDIAIIGTGSGNSILDERYDGQTRGDLRAGCVRRHLPQRRLHPDEDVRLRRRGRSKCQGISTIRGRRARRRGPVGRHRVAGLRPHRPDRHGRRELPPLVAQRRGVRQPHPVPADRCPTAATRCAPTTVTSSPPIRWSSRPDHAPSVPDAIAECGVPYHTSDTIMRIADVPEHLIIVGGGFIACEFAHIFSALGSHVTLLIRGSTLLRGHDDDICERFTDIASQEVGDPQPPRVVRRSGRSATASRSAATTARRCAATRCWSPPGGRPTVTCSTPNRPASRSPPTVRSSSTSTNAPPRVAFSRSATCRRTSSSSTSPTTRRAW